MVVLKSRLCCVYSGGCAVHDLLADEECDGSETHHAHELRLPATLTALALGGAAGLHVRHAADDRVTPARTVPRLDALA